MFCLSSQQGRQTADAQELRQSQRKRTVRETYGGKRNEVIKGMIYGAGHKVERGGEADKENSWEKRNQNKSYRLSAKFFPNSMRLEENIKSGGAAS